MYGWHLQHLGRHPASQNQRRPKGSHLDWKKLLGELPDPECGPQILAIEQEKACLKLINQIICESHDLSRHAASADMRLEPRGTDA